MYGEWKDEESVHTVSYTEDGLQIVYDHGTRMSKVGGLNSRFIQKKKYLKDRGP